MAHDNFCNCSIECSGECPDNLNCPLDSNGTSLGKNKSISRRRHHDSVRHKNKDTKTLDVVTAKSGRLPDTATTEEIVRAEKKCKNASKKIHSKKSS